MRDPYLYEEINVLKNLANIKDRTLLAKAEADITNLAMLAIYNQKYDKFEVSTLLDIHNIIFGQIYDWAGEFRTIQIVKYEDVLGGDTVRYTSPNNIKKELTSAMKEISKLKMSKDDNREVVFKLVRIIANIWQIHPFREGNTRAIIVFAVLFAKSLGFTVKHELLKTHSAYVRNSLVWASQGIYSKYEYLEKIFYDSILDDSINSEHIKTRNENYDMIGEYKINQYVERPHEYIEE